MKINQNNLLYRIDIGECLLELHYNNLNILGLFYSTPFLLFPAMIFFVYRITKIEEVQVLRRK